MSTYQPYESIERPSRGMFTGLSSGPPGTVHVVDRDGYPLTVLRSPEDRLTAGEARFGRIRNLYVVDVGEHVLEFDEDFPCRGANGRFHGRIELTCHVVDAEAVVRRHVEDATAALKPTVARVVRQVCQRFDAEQQSDAEQAAQSEVLRAAQNGGLDPAFRLDHLHLKLEVDEAAERYLVQLKEDQRTRARDSSTTKVRLERLRHEAEMARRRQEAELEALRHAADLQTAELEQLRQRSEAEADLDHTRVRHFLEALAKGDHGLLALEMVRDPSAVTNVIDRQAKERRELGERQLKALELLLQHDALEGWQAREQAKSALAQLASLFMERPSISAVQVTQERVITAESKPEASDEANWDPGRLPEDEDPE